MKLLLDIGNTRIKWAYCNSDGLIDAGDVVHRGRLEMALAELPQRLQHPPAAVAAVNVAGEQIETQLAATFAEAFDITVEFARVSKSAGKVCNGYTEWQQLGVDRWAAIVAAWQQLRSDVCVVDAGTAVTIDLVCADGRHLGGVILPGLRMMEASLGMSTADIADFSAGQAGPGKPDWYGRATAEAVQRGAHFALSAAIDRAVQRFPTGARPLVLLTGGDAPDLLPSLRSPAEMQPLLVLEGLRHLSGGMD